MDGMVGTKSTLTWVVHISVVLLVAAWLFPTLGLLVSSFRTADQISGSGWWAALFPSVQNEILRAADPDEFRVADGDEFMVSGNLFGGESPKEISVWGTSSRAIDIYVPGDVAEERVVDDQVPVYLLQPDPSQRPQQLPEFLRNQIRIAIALNSKITVELPAVPIPKKINLRWPAIRGAEHVQRDPGGEQLDCRCRVTRHVGEMSEDRLNLVYRSHDHAHSLGRDFMSLKNAVQRGGQLSHNGAATGTPEQDHEKPAHGAPLCRSRRIVDRRGLPEDFIRAPDDGAGQGCLVRKAG